MPANELFAVLAFRLGISVSEIARRNGKSPQAFFQKIKRDGFTAQELSDIADSVGCKYESAFILPNGDRIEERFTKSNPGKPSIYTVEGETQVAKKAWLSDADIERRCRYRLSLRNFKLHKEKSQWDNTYYYCIYEDGEDWRNVDDSAYMGLNQLLDYCEELAEKDAEYRAERIRRSKP